MTHQANPSCVDLIKNPMPKPTDKTEQWQVFNKSWEDQIRGKGIKVHEEHASAKLRAAMVGDPFAVEIPELTPEMEGLIRDNASEEMYMNWKENGGKAMRDIDPERFDKICEEIAGRDEKYEAAGVTIIKNKLGWYPEEALNYNGAWNGPRLLSIYAGAKWRGAHNGILVAEDCGPVKGCEASSRAATIALIEEDPEAAIIPFLSHEPNPTIVGPGFGGLDLADWRLMPNKTILWGYGVADRSQIAAAQATGEHTPAGWPRGRDLFMRLLDRLGYKQETWWFDSNLGYHEDCVMMNLVEGVVGLPDDGKFGQWGELPLVLKDWEILPIAVEDVKNGACNATTLGDGRIFIDSSCTQTMKLLESKGYEPIPIDYQTCWTTFNSGIDCSDSNIWREND
ncbi:hypothetical protein [Paraferrimonas sedimenticola]|uniref:Uncharacterized protein n=1 Tax=Paraferrimonas sedimenticola TaxID=375674 RepID=A0AA37RVN3_9GAMM|nr:hypothetical protein [Paraferrimonas sedimenticola]GLP96061.1 hypothetical protein GCM10007895_13670 [Paraferrimonas sedimenticola]